jgi:hypothetical protein
MKNPIIYSEEFRNLVLKAYPNSPDIKTLLDNNEYFLGRYLDDCSYGCVPSIPSSVIIEKINTGKLDELRRMAEDRLAEEEKLQLRKDCYRMWDKECFLD